MESIASPEDVRTETGANKAGKKSSSGKRKSTTLERSPPLRPPSHLSLSQVAPLTHPMILMGSSVSVSSETARELSQIIPMETESRKATAADRTALVPSSVPTTAESLVSTTNEDGYISLDPSLEIDVKDPLQSCDKAALSPLSDGKPPVPSLMENVGAQSPSSALQARESLLDLASDSPSSHPGQVRRADFLRHKESSQRAEPTTTRQNNRNLPSGVLFIIIDIFFLGRGGGGC